MVASASPHQTFFFGGRGLSLTLRQPTNRESLGCQMAVALAGCSRTSLVSSLQQRRFSSSGEINLRVCRGRKATSHPVCARRLERRHHFIDKGHGLPLVSMQTDRALFGCSSGCSSMCSSLWAGTLRTLRSEPDCLEGIGQWVASFSPPVVANHFAWFEP